MIGSGRSSRTLRRLLAVLASAAALGSPAAARSDVPPPDEAAAALPATAGGVAIVPDDAAFEGRVAAYLLSPEAGVAGLIFEDGRQVTVPPHLGPRLAALIQPGQQARVGPRRDDAPGPGSRRSIQSIANGRVLDEGSPEAAPSSPAVAGGGLRPMQAEGTIRLRLHGPRGETNGLLLGTGTQIFFPPHVARELRGGLRPGDAIQVEGYGRRSDFGTVLQATRITGPDGLSMTVYGPAEGPPAKGAERGAPRRTP